MAQYPEASNSGKALPRLALKEQGKGQGLTEGERERRLVRVRGTSDRSRGLQ